MPKTLSKESILATLSEEKLGFKFGKPDRPNESSLACILPILRETTLKRQYITMPETEQVIVTDSGTIYKINIENASKENVFLRSGSIFEGKGTQSRIITRSSVVFPGQKVSLDARCVHASHGIRTGSQFKYGGTVPTSIENAMYSGGFTPRDQRTVWENVTRTTTAMNTMSGRTRPRGVMGQSRPIPSRSMRTPSQNMQQIFTQSLNKLHNETSEDERCVSFSGFASNIADPAAMPIMDSAFGHIAGDDNLKQNFDAFAKDFDSILSKARLHDNQVGLALITVTGCKTIELFDVSVSWESLHKDAVKKMGTELLRGEDKTNVFEYKPENAVNAVKKVLGLDYKTNLIYEHKPSNGEPHVQISGLTADKYVGEVVELDGKVIHLVLLEVA